MYCSFSSSLVSLLSRSRKAVLLSMQKDLALEVKIAKPLTAGTYASVFYFCAGRCCHNSASVNGQHCHFGFKHMCTSLQLNQSLIAKGLESKCLLVVDRSSKRRVELYFG